MSAAVTVSSSASNLGFVRRYLRIIVCVVICLILGVLIYWRLQILPDLQAHSDRTSKELDIMLRNQTQGAELGEQLAELKRLTSSMNDRLVQLDDKATNSQFFYDLESRSRSSIMDLKQGSLSQGDGTTRAKLNEFTALSFNLNVSGRIGYIMNFLKRLESGKYFVRCESVTLKGNATLAVDAVDAQLKLEILAKKQ